ncbi:MAG: hypothetical protein A4E72_00669 [Syntrophus sp. PtaU1.Bin208]|nr:MAG: hypothetical protein A4E72_00669 [Syntrophus sp. PtaU1.Bin208]
MYRTRRYSADISIGKYLDEYVDVPKFLELCQACPNYNRKWSCPPYDFGPEDYWNKYEKMHIIGTKIIFDEEVIGRKYPSEETNNIVKTVIRQEQSVLLDELLGLEEKYAGSIGLAAGSCNICENCTRPYGNACNHADKLRYSIESLGGDVEKTVKKLLGLELQWMREGNLPEYFLLVNALLTPS